jgi:ABC-type antimicrobial peptide transport system permease subunit
VRQFLLEAMALTSLGGFIGVTLAVLASYTVMFFVPALPAAIPMWAVLGLTRKED